MDMNIVAYLGVVLGVLSALMNYIKLDAQEAKRLWQIIFRGWVLVSLAFLTQAYARDLYKMLQPGQPVNLKTIVIGHGLMLGLISFAVMLPILFLHWRKTDSAG
ncbi:hypothetical protein ACIPZC_21235 [Pseudomonas sp. NPDC089743]|uniref:hypothetical protein n=1 Tax=Pseudomonas sp. NPDC089743 TaxID=3364471 RepID=UPI00382DD7D4